MTITTNDTRDEYTATAGQTVFNYTFKIFADTDLLVYQTASGATPDDTTDLITAYTVTGVGNANGGTIVLDTGATLNDKITIVSNISYERDTDYQFNGDYTADVVNDEQDKQLSLIKQVKEEVSRTMQFPRAAQSATGKVLPQPSDLADCVLAFDSNGDPVAGPSATSMQALIDAAEAVIANSNAGAVSATKVGASTYWTFTDVQGFINQLIAKTGAGFPIIKQGLTFESTAGDRWSSFGLSSWALDTGTGTAEFYKFIDAWFLSVDSDGANNGGAMVLGNQKIRFTVNGSTGDFTKIWADVSGGVDTGGVMLDGVNVALFDKTAGADFPVGATAKYIQPDSYANLAAINAAIPSPAHGMMVMTASQGMAVYKTSSWVRAVDETTAIT